MTVLAWQLIVLMIAVVLGAIVIRAVRKARPEIERNLRLPWRSEWVRRRFEVRFGTMSASETIIVLVGAAASLWIGTYLGWIEW
jgi:hypothetical protein